MQQREITTEQLLAAIGAYEMEVRMLRMQLAERDEAIALLQTDDKKQEGEPDAPTKQG